MPRYEYGCPLGHRFVVRAGMGEASHAAPCPDCGATAPRAYSVPTLITSYPMGLGEALEQVARDREERERSYVRPSHEELMERVRSRMDAKRRREAKGAEAEKREEHLRQEAEVA